MTGKGRWLDADPRWQHLQGSYEDLVGLAEAWPVTTSTPEPVSEMLRSVRLMFAHTWFVYELGLPAVAWSLLALEAGLRERLGRSQRHDRTSLGRLINEAVDAGLIKPEWHPRLDAARQLRNQLAHGHMHGVMTPGMLDGILKAAHEVVADLFPDRR